MNIIGLKKANCKNCYKCIKVCPVKSIKISDEQAHIISDECILCGTCLHACPQNAKTLSSDLEKVREFIRHGEDVYVSLAPSYYTMFDLDDPQRIVGALKKLGVKGVSQTTDGAAYVTAEYHRLVKEGSMENIITTCCPAINALAEKYYPGVVKYLAPVVSPMIAHGRLLKKAFGERCKVVFVGPCIAKKAESEDLRHCNEIDAVLNFMDLDLWASQEDIKISECEPEPFIQDNSEINRLYPIPGGIIKSIKKIENNLPYSMIGVDNIDACKELFEAMIAGELKGCFAEVNACEGGCINGPVASETRRSKFLGRVELSKHVAKTGDSFPVLDSPLELSKTFAGAADRKLMPTEREIREILRKIGKETPEQELNCGSCGYPSCREKAIAVFQGKADINMCLPFMRQRAESLSNYVLAETPNITVIVDEELNIIEFNRAAEKLFGITRTQALQKGIYELIDPADFLYVLDTGENIIDKKSELTEYGATVLQSIIKTDDGNYIMGIFKDITEEEERKKASFEMKMSSVEMAQKVIEKQMTVAQEIASLLGETTAETKVTLTKLKDMIENGGEAK